MLVEWAPASGRLRKWGRWPGAVTPYQCLKGLSTHALQSAWQSICELIAKAASPAPSHPVIIISIITTSFVCPPESWWLGWGLMHGSGVIMLCNKRGPQRQTRAAQYSIGNNWVYTDGEPPLAASAIYISYLWRFRPIWCRLTGRDPCMKSPSPYGCKGVCPTPEKLSR